MDIKTANKLVELRKEHNLSQEELATSLGVSRQAVSKWERGEASPDTDNLVALAKLYGISLDELLEIDVDKEETIEVKEVISENHSSFNEGKLCGALYIAAVIIYLILGFLFELFGKVWPIFFAPVVISSFVGALICKDIKHFNYPLFIVFMYTQLSAIFDLWHPLWILFITIPLFYIVIDLFRKKR